MNERAVLLSITPEFADKIANGSKSVELRRRFPNVPSGTWVYLYSTLPIGAVTGRAKIIEIDVGSPRALWKKHREMAGISARRFNQYFDGRDSGSAVKLIAYEKIGPVDLSSLRDAIRGFVAPQSYRFLTEDEQTLILAK